MTARRMTLGLGAALYLGLGMGVALADRAAADRCAGALSPLGKTLYDRALPDVLRGTAIPDALRSVGRSMVMSGSATRDTARPAGEAAGACLVQIHQPG